MSNIQSMYYEYCLNYGIVSGYYGLVSGLWTSNRTMDQYPDYGTVSTLWSSIRTMD